MAAKYAGSGAAGDTWSETNNLRVLPRSLGGRGTSSTYTGMEGREAEEWLSG